MKEPQKSKGDNFLERNAVYLGFILMSVNFGHWQKNIDAGGFMFITCLTLHMLYRKHRLDVWQEKDIEWKVRRLASKLWNKKMDEESDRITH